MSAERITRADLESARIAHEAALRRYGMIGADETIGLAIGSRTYGNAYRVWVNRPSEGSGHYSHPTVRSSGYLGMTSRDAYDRLVTATATIHDVMYSVDRHPRVVTS